MMSEGELPFHLLSETERQCLRLVHQGYTSRDIAAERGVRPDSIDKILRIARRKLGDFDRHELAKRLVTAEVRQGERERTDDDDVVPVTPAQSLGVQSAGLAQSTEQAPNPAPAQPTESRSSSPPRGAVSRLLDLTDGDVLRRLLVGSHGSPSNDLDSWSRTAVISIVAACAGSAAAAIVPLLIVIERIAASL
jgi:DNA-binding CsgD family transcriptional regulator